VHLVDHAVVLGSPHRGLLLQPEGLEFAVVVDLPGLSFDELVDAVALLPEEREVSGGGAVLVALGILADHQPVGAKQDGPLGEHHVAGEHVDLLEVVVLHPVGFDVDRLVAIGLFRGGRPRKDRRERKHQRRAYRRAAEQPGRKSEGGERAHGQRVGGGGCQVSCTRESTRNERAALLNSMPTPVKTESPRSMRTGWSVRAISVSL